MQNLFKNIYKKVKAMIMSLVPSFEGKTTRDFRFYKEQNGNWYVDLPEWIGGKWNLQMVEGADDLLEHLRSTHRNDVTLHVSLEPFEGCSVLEKIEDDIMGDGADYKVLDAIGNPRFEEIWLCGVTAWYYNHMPENIYYRKVLD